MVCQRDPNGSRRFLAIGPRGFFGSTGQYPGLYAGIDPAWRGRIGSACAVSKREPSIDTEEVISEVAPPGPAQATASAIRSKPLAALEAALFASVEPLTLNRLVNLAGLEDTGQARTLIRQLNDSFDAENSAFRIEEIAGGFQLLTHPDLTEWLKRFAPPRQEPQISPPALEVLAIVAYRQPIGRADIEAIRGVQVAEILKQLLDRSLIRLSGRDESLGRPFLYATTKKFLETFGLRSLRELPLVEYLSRPENAPSPAPVAPKVTAQP